jgi:site-specific recombinase XerD
LIAAFLDDLEKNRGITIRSRNLRLTAIRSFFHYAAYEEPSRAAQIQRVLAISGKRHTRTLVHFLARPEIDALLAAPDQQTWLGRRDHAFLLVAVQTGLRLSELTGLQRGDVVLGRGAHVRCVGKGRKERCTPLAKTAVAVLKAWLREPPKHRTEVLFPTARGGRLSPDSVADLLAKHVAVACKSCPSLRKKHVTPHVLRHSMAMGLLQAGVDRAVIALWLGHESVETTQIYLEANLAMKEEILAKTTPLNGKPGRYRPGDRLLEFLQNL